MNTYLGPVLIHYFMFFCSFRYATSPQLNSWTPLIHDEYAVLCSQGQQQLASPTSYNTTATPVHLTLDVNTLAVRAYASRKLGLAPSEAASPNRLFVPLRTEMKVGKKEQAGCEHIYVAGLFSLEI